MIGLITLTGQSCSGKSTILNALLHDEQSFCSLVSFTSRSARAYELGGKDYFFTSHEDFEKRIDNNEFIEWINYNGNYYGVTVEEFTNKVNSSRVPIIVVEPNGVIAYSKHIANLGKVGLHVFVETPESIRVDRLIDRASQDLLNIVSLGQDVKNIISTHFKRLFAMIIREKDWFTAANYSLIVDGKSLHNSTAAIYSAIRENQNGNA